MDEQDYTVVMRNNHTSRSQLYRLVEDLAKGDCFWSLGARKYAGLRPLSFLVSALNKKKGYRQQVQALWYGYLGKREALGCDTEINLNSIDSFVKQLNEGAGYSRLVMWFKQWDDLVDIKKGIKQIVYEPPDFSIRFRKSRIFVDSNDSELRKTLMEDKLSLQNTDWLYPNHLF